jgi:nicotinamidase-related amidase
MRAPVLIVIDLLNDFLDAWPAAARQELIESTNALIGLMRRHGRPVIWMRQEFRADLSDAFPGAARQGHADHDRGHAGMSDRGGPRARTVRPGAGEETLQRVLRHAARWAARRPQACIRMSAIDAYQRDWAVIVAADCVGSYDRAYHDISLRYMDGKIARVMRNEEIAAMVGGGS